uniref:F-box domain-containing protein n=1 Tax=Trichuris muris TaxID=70415 RepID=A0A5S6QEI6_TRIMR
MVDLPDLPDCCLLFILAQLPIRTLIQLRLVNKTFYRLCTESLRGIESLCLPELLKTSSASEQATSSTKQHELRNAVAHFICSYGSRLRTLHFGPCWLVFGQQVANAISHTCQSITELNFSSVTFECDISDMLLSLSKQLLVLKLKNASWTTDSNCRAMQFVLPQMSSLQVLDLECFYSLEPPFDVKSLVALSPSLRRLNLSGFVWLCSQQILLILEQLRNLVELRLSRLTPCLDGRIICSIASMKCLNILEMNNICRSDLQLNNLASLGGSLNQLYLNDNNSLDAPTKMQIRQACTNLRVFEAESSNR